MPFSQQKLDQVHSGIERALSSGVLNDWERKFLTDMQARLRRDGRNTTLSEKQYRKLMKLAGTDTNVSSPTSAPTTSPSATRRVSGSVATKPRQPRPRSAPTYYSRQPRPPRIVRRLNRNLKYLAILAPFFLVFGIIGSLTGSDPASHSGGTTTGGGSYAVQLAGRSIKVIDGDTVRVPGESRRVRLVGFNTPEVFSSRCAREKQLGDLATQRLRQLLRSAQSVEFQRVACACKPGTEGTKACNHGRICGTLSVNGTDVGRTLISEGLAARYQCGRTSCPPPPGNWCGGWMYGFPGDG